MHVRLNRPDKRNAMSGAMVRELQTVFVNLPREARVAVISGEGAHFCAGLDLSRGHGAERRRRHASTRACGMRRFDQIQYGPVPVIVVLHGAVVGGGLELAATAHLRVAEAQRVLRPARRAARHLRRRQRLGAHPAADRRRRA